MKLINLFVFAIRVFLSLGLIHGYGHIILDMARSAVHAHTQDSLSAKKFNRMLWSGGKDHRQSSSPQRGRK